MMRRAEQGEIAGLQYLRGFAALAVVTDHTFGATLAEQPKSILASFAFLKYGALGVDLFFLISGFIICIIALQGPELLPASGAKKFAQKRFVRIIPLMWLMIIAYVIARYLSSGAVHTGPYLRALFLLPYGDLEPNQLWTLRHEAIFYALFAISFLGARRRAWVLAIWFLAPFADSLLSLPDRPDTVLGQAARILANPVNAEFAAGLVLGILWHRGSRKRSFSLPFPPLMLLAMVLAFLTAGWALDLASARLPDTLISAVFCVPILLAGVHVRPVQGLLHQIAETTGNASYSLYLFHPIFGEAALHLLRGQPALLMVTAAMVSAIAGGVLVHLFVERPLVSAGRKWLALSGHGHGRRFLADTGS